MVLVMSVTTASIQAMLAKLTLTMMESVMHVKRILMEMVGITNLHTKQAQVRIINPICLSASALC